MFQLLKSLESIETAPMFRNIVQKNPMYHHHIEPIRFETMVRREGMVPLPDVEEGERVGIIVLELPNQFQPQRRGGWAEGKIQILPGFDDPIPGMEEYVKAICSQTRMYSSGPERTIPSWMIRQSII